MKKIVLGLCLAVLVAMHISAQTAVLLYSEGTVESSNANNAWQAVSTGAELPLGIVRVRDNGIAEFKVANGVIHLAKDGSYDLLVLASQAKAKGSISVLQRTANSLVKLTSSTAVTKQGTVAGVRADDNTIESDVQWVSPDDSARSDGISKLEQARQLLAQSKLQQALNAADSVIESGADDVQAARLLRVQVLAMQGLSGAAVREIRKISFDPKDALYSDYLSLSASQFLEIRDWDTALLYAKLGLEAQSEPQSRQPFHFLQALALKGKGQTTASETALRAVVSDDKNTEIASEAQRLLVH